MLNRFHSIALGTCLLLAVVGFSSRAGAQVQSGYVPPVLTDPALTNFSAPHFVALTSNPAARRNQLLLHLPGTGHEPWQATNWVLTAAALGYHAISIKYQNLPSSAAFCSANTNLECFRLVTEENLTGAVWADGDPAAIKQVTLTDSITNRVVKLLHFLSTNALTTGGNWGQFLGPAGVRWDKVAVSGHSQGGSCAGLLAKLYEVDRAVLFSTVDWIYFPTNTRPTWFAEAGLTPAERIYGFTHFNDFGGPDHEQQPLLWQDLGLTGFGPIVRVESNAPPYSGSHTLTTLLPPATTNDSGSLEYHASVIIDRAIPTNAAGTVTWVPVWNYLLTNLAAPLAPSLALSTNDTGQWQISWPGNSGFSSQLEHSPNLVEWAQLDLPTPEVNAIMSLEIPPYLLVDDERFFRLARHALITSPIPTTPGFHTNLTYVHGGIARNYYLGVPAGWNAATNWPLMLALPGHGQSIAEFAGGQSELRLRASNDGMILVFAEATSGVGSYRWFPYENPNASQPYVDDAAFLLALVNELVASGLSVNTNRIYLSGFSNGGSMTHFLAGRTNHPFAAFAIMESGTAPTSFYREPYDRFAPDAGTVVAANVPTPWQPRPVMLMNMTTSIPWPFEGRQVTTNIFFRGARHNIARWTLVNGHGAITNESGLVEPPITAIKTNIQWTATGNDRARVANEDVRPDWNWPTNLVANGWPLTNALRFRYTTTVGTNVVDQRLPEWVNTAYPHTIQPDPVSPTTHVRVDSGTMTVELWRTDPLNRTNEVIFIGLSDGGHQWPNAADKLPFKGSEEVLKFFNAH